MSSSVRILICIGLLPENPYTRWVISFVEQISGIPFGPSPDVPKTISAIVWLFIHTEFGYSMESEDKVRGKAPVVLIIALLLLSLLPMSAVASEGSGGETPFLEQGSDGAVEVRSTPDPVDITDVKEIIEGKVPGEQFGGQTAGVGDVDHDGYDDIAVLVPARGICVVYQGGPNLREFPVHPMYGTDYVLSAQSQVRPAGDIDSDGFDDVVITAPDLYVNGLRAAGAIFVFYGSPSGLREQPDQVILGTEKDMRFGSDVDSLGDINDDGYSDLIVGAEGWSEETGMVAIYLGGFDGLSKDPIWVWMGENVGDRFGHAVTGAGDLNADGYLDFAVGAPFATSGEGKGRIYVFYGDPDLSSIVVGTVVDGTMGKTYFGLSIRLAGDVNNDGFSDLMVSAPQEPGGPYQNPGKVQLYTGYEHGIHETPAWSLVGQSDDALLGFNIAFLGDVNRDGYDDVAIGAPGHSSEGKNERGKFYIFLGDSTGFRDDPSVVEVGRSAGDHMSGGLAGAGDLDGDGFADVLVGVPGADSSTGINVGELQIYRGSDLTMPPLTADAFEVMDLEEGGLILVEYRHYQFRLSVTHRTGIRAVDYVDLHLDPEGEDVVLRYYQETQMLKEISDDGNLAEGRFVRLMDSDTWWDTTSVMLDIKLHWGFPTARPLSVRLEATDEHGLRVTGRWSDTALVVDRLTFSDPIQVLADDQGELAWGSWVSSSEGLTFTGASVLYDLLGIDGAPTVPFHPPTGKLLVVVRDDTGGEWSQLVIHETPVSVKAVTPATSRPDMTYTVTIETPDRTKVFAMEQFLLNVDGTPVSFSNPEPKDPIASLRGTATVVVEDPLGPGVGSRVEYRLDRAGDYEGFGEWTRTGLLSEPDEDGRILASAEDTFTEGSNYIQWRAWDAVGNGPSISFIYPIVVDLGNISFTNPLPVAGTWHRTETVTVGITVENTRGNELDLDNIQYRISTSPGVFTSWRTFQASVPEGSDGSRVTITTQERMSEGDDNYIQWRARDLERREFITSALHRVLVDLTGPEFTGLSPLEDTFVNSPNVQVTVTVDDVLSGVDETQIWYNVLGEDEWHPPLSRTHRGDVVECTARVSLKEGVDNFVRWKATDSVGHLSEPFEMRVMVDLTAPTVSLIAPEDVVTTSLVDMTIRVADGGPLDRVSGVDLDTLEYAVSRPSTEGYGQWVHPAVVGDLKVVEFALVTVQIEVDDGDQNLVIWRVTDASEPAGGANAMQSEPIRIVADLPESGDLLKPVIKLTEPRTSRVPYGSSVFFSASESFHPRGEVLEYRWVSDRDGVIGESPSFSTSLSKGIHTITLEVTAEPSGAKATMVFQVSVEDAVEGEPPLSALWEQATVILIVALVAMTLVLRRWRIRL
jgi:hypothetical protein